MTKARTNPPKRISLAEAVTWLMGEQRRTPEAEAAKRVSDEQELSILAKPCGPVWPEESLGALLLGELLPVDLDWPEPVRALAEAVKRQMCYRDSFDVHMRELLRQARTGGIDLYGSRLPGTRAVGLSADDISGRRRLARNFRDLVPHGDASYRPSGTADDSRPVWYGVAVAEHHVPNLLSSCTGTTVPRAREPEPPLEDVVAWIRSPDQAEFRNLSGSNGKHKQEIELVRAFPGVSDPKATLVAAKIRRGRGRPKTER